MATVYIIMGVSGCGKTSVGQELAARLKCPFFDGDDFHPPGNVAKMASGQPLSDDDRTPWLARLHTLIREQLDKGETAVLACSALRKKYRNQLRTGNDRVQFIYLDGTFDLIWQRMATRTDHYMKAEMLQSQFDTLERPSKQEAITLSIDQPVDKIISDILRLTPA